MSLAPASIRGACLKARLAVNGIQNAARSFGTLTADGGGLLSSIDILMHFAGAAVARQAISFHRARKPAAGAIAVNSAGLKMRKPQVRHADRTCLQGDATTVRSEALPCRLARPLVPPGL